MLADCVPESWETRPGGRVEHAARCASAADRHRVRGRFAGRPPDLAVMRSCMLLSKWLTSRRLETPAGAAYSRSGRSPRVGRGARGNAVPEAAPAPRERMPRASFDLGRRAATAAAASSYESRWSVESRGSSPQTWRARRYLSWCRVDETSSSRRGSDQEIAELAALADGSLAPERRVALEARVAASSELADRLAEQQRAVALARSAGEGVEAPAALRARIDAQRRARRAPATASSRPGRCRCDRRGWSSPWGWA